MLVVVVVVVVVLDGLWSWRLPCRKTPQLPLVSQEGCRVAFLPL